MFSMINLMSLDTSRLEPRPGHFPWPASPFGPNEIDLLCCQSVPHDPTGHVPANRWPPPFPGLTCSCFAAGRPRRPAVPDDGPPPGGLAICTGPEVWVLNSGSFTIGEGDAAALVQFALIRKHGAPLLAFNLQLSPLRDIWLRQLHELFAHALIRSSHGAVALCADRAIELSVRQRQQLTARSGYVLRQTPLTSSGNDLLGLFTARRPKTPTTGSYWSARAATVNAGHASNPSVSTMTVEIKRINPGTPRRLAFPLSFREQWLGPRKQRALA